MLFRDGWMYSLTDFEGPEWGPPANHRELDELVAVYWSTRRGKLVPLLASLVHRLQQLRDMSLPHSLPVQQVVVVDTREGKRRGYQPLSTRPLEEKIGWVRRDIEECDERLTEIAVHLREQAEKESA